MIAYCFDLSLTLIDVDIPREGLPHEREVLGISHDMWLRQYSTERFSRGKSA